MPSELWDYLDPGFLAPWWLLAALLAVPTLALLEFRAYRERRRALRSFAAGHLLGALAGSVSPAKRVLKSLLLIAATALFFIALARPVLLFDWTDERRAGLDVMLALDCSKSMLTQDVKPSRLERAQLAIADFADHLPENRLGLIAFAGDAFLECPLTLDHDAFLTAVRDADTDTIPKPGTDIATAIDEAVDALRSQPNNLKFLILITDGEDLEGRALDAAKNAAQSGLRIYTVGVGTAAGDRIPERDEMGQTSFHRDPNGQEVVSHLDEAMLRQIADATGGAYLPLGQDGAGLEQIYDRYIAPLPKQNLAEKRQKIRIERFEWPLGLAILLLMAEFLINDRARSPQVPLSAVTRPAVHRGRRSKGRTREPAVLAVLVLLAAASPSHGAAAADAERAYKSGDYEQAMQDYQKAAGENQDASRLQFNRGDAAYKAGEYSDAEEAYRRALETPDLGLQEQSYYNLGNAQYQHGAAMLKASSRKTVKLWEDALHSYQCALQLKDSPDAAHNYEIVKEKLKQLKQQRKERGQKGNGDQGQGQTGQGSQSSPSNNPQSGKGDPDDSDDDDSGEQKQGDQPGTDQKKGGPGPNPKDAQTPSNAPGNQQVRAYSGTRNQDQKDPGIRSREDAKNLLDSLKDDEHRVSARALSSDNQNAPPPSGKDW